MIPFFLVTITWFNNFFLLNYEFRFDELEKKKKSLNKKQKKSNENTNTAQQQKKKKEKKTHVLHHDFTAEELRQLFLTHL